jgi:hypothetical protein
MLDGYNNIIQQNTAEYNGKLDPGGRRISPK